MRTYCRFCGRELKNSFVDLGLSPLSNEYIPEEKLACGQYFYPLAVDVCDACFLVQARAFSKPEDIFSDYKYFSSYSKSWLRHCREYVEKIVPLLRLNDKSSVVEIACNDGYLLQYFQPYGIPVYGVEPAANVAEEAKKRGIEVVVDFFSDRLVPSLTQRHGRADLIIGNNVLAHVPDINGFVAGLALLLAENGTITMEFPHLLKLMRLNQFDTIYHEHFSYFSLLTVKRIFEEHRLKIVRVDELETHGGSIRIYAAHDANAADVDVSVSRILAQEMEYGLARIETYTGFGENVKKIKRDSVRLLSRLKERGKRIAAFGAAAKGNTFLNYCGIGRDLIDYVVDSNPHKQGLYLPGTRIPIVDKEALMRTKPDYLVILPWNLRDEIATEAAPVREWGCKLLTFIPKAAIF